MALVIPTTSDPYYVQRTDLEGREYVFSFDWSTREQVWYMSLLDSEETEIVCSVKLVCDWPLLFRLASTAAPPGQFLVISKTTDDSPPGKDDLAPGGRCELTYVPSDALRAQYAG